MRQSLGTQHIPQALEQMSLTWKSLSKLRRSKKQYRPVPSTASRAQVLNEVSFGWTELMLKEIQSQMLVELDLY